MSRSLFDDTTPPLPRSTPPRPLGALLSAGNVRARPEKYRLDSGECVIGSAPTADWVIEAPTVSRQHCRLELVPEGVLVVELGSRNGTFYMGQRIERAAVPLGASMSLGDVEILIAADRNGRAAPATAGEASFGLLLGTSPAMHRLFAMLGRLRGSVVPLLVEGESGVGKELAARAVHAESPVSRGPLVAVNCGALSRELLASELFGHVRGAFTGAHGARAGAFESAQGGTLFLDEIGELPLDMQPALLRAIEAGEVKRVGSDEVRKVQVRVIAATNRDVESDVAQGRFREDLFYRLAVVRLRIPPLRERREDIELYARKFAAEAGVAELDRTILDELSARTYPGNVRELRNAVLAYSVMGALPAAHRGVTSLPDSVLAEIIDPTQPYADQKEAVVDRFNKVYLRALMVQALGNQSVASRMAGLDRTYLGRLLQKYGVKP